MKSIEGKPAWMVFGYCVNHARANQGQFPTSRMIQKEFDPISLSTVHRYIDQMVDAGLITRHRRVTRSVYTINDLSVQVTGAALTAVREYSRLSKWVDKEDV